MCMERLCHSSPHFIQTLYLLTCCFKFIRGIINEFDQERITADDDGQLIFDVLLDQLPLRSDRLIRCAVIKCRTVSLQKGIIVLPRLR